MLRSGAGDPHLRNIYITLIYLAAAGESRSPQVIPPLLVSQNRPVHRYSGHCAVSARENTRVPSFSSVGLHRTRHKRRLPSGACYYSLRGELGILTTQVRACLT
jgi:hypothetical protein